MIAVGVHGNSNISLLGDQILSVDTQVVEMLGGLEMEQILYVGAEKSVSRDRKSTRGPT